MKSVCLQVSFCIFISGLGQNLMASENPIQCIKLEGLTIGCIPSESHLCKRNKALDEPNAPCNYVGSPSTSIEVDGALAWNCATAETNEICENVQTLDGIVRRCRTISRCIQYRPPICNEICVPCFNEVVTAFVGRSAGCIICSRPSCEDEPQVVTQCPAHHGGRPNGHGAKCNPARRCPTTAVDPNGQTHTVQVNQATNCRPPELPVPTEMPLPKKCPWKVDERVYVPGQSPSEYCTPIREGNRND